MQFHKTVHDLRKVGTIHPKRCVVERYGQVHVFWNPLAASRASKVRRCHDEDEAYVGLDPEDVAAAAAAAGAAADEDEGHVHAPADGDCAGDGADPLDIDEDPTTTLVVMTSGIFECILHSSECELYI